MRSQKHAAAIFFTIVGVDEGYEICGAAADVAYNAKDDTITGTMSRAWRRRYPTALWQWVGLP